MVFIPLEKYLCSILLEHQDEMPELMMFQTIGWIFDTCKRIYVSIRNN